MKTNRRMSHSGSGLETLGDRGEGPREDWAVEDAANYIVNPDAFISDTTNAIEMTQIAPEHKTGLRHLTGRLSSRLRRTITEKRITLGMRSEVREVIREGGMFTLDIQTHLKTVRLVSSHFHPRVRTMAVYPPPRRPTPSDLCQMHLDCANTTFVSFLNDGISTYGAKPVRYVLRILGHPLMVVVYVKFLIKVYQRFMLYLALRQAFAGWSSPLGIWGTAKELVGAFCLCVLLTLVEMWPEIIIAIILARRGVDADMEDEVRLPAPPAQGRTDSPDTTNWWNPWSWE